MGPVPCGMRSRWTAILRNGPRTALPGYRRSRLITTAKERLQAGAVGVAAESPTRCAC